MMNSEQSGTDTTSFSPGTTYACTNQGCDKSFKRKDHLRRHAVNHSHQTFNCGLCHRPFKRMDLMLRHERRQVCASAGAGAGGIGNGYNDGSEERASQSFNRRKSDPPSTSTSTSTDWSNTSLLPPIPSPQTLIDNTNTSNPDPSPFYQDTNGNGNGNGTKQFIVGNFPGDFGASPTPQAAWENLLTDNLVNPLHEPILTIPWDKLATTIPIDATQSFESVPGMLLAKLQRAYPEFDVSLSYFLDAQSLYWSHVAPSFPFVHRGTFDINLAPIELAIMLAIVGSVHVSSTSSIRRNFSPLVQRIRGILVEKIRLDMPVSTLQAFSLCHIYDTWWGTSENQFVAQCMWPIVVAHSRKKGIGVAGRPDYHDEQRVTWAVWAKDEERRRAAYCVTLFDTQLSGFWNQHCSRQLSVFAHNLVLPCSKGQWDAPTAQDWLKVRSTPQSSTFHSQSHLQSQSQSSMKKESRSSYLPGLHPKFAVQTIPEGYSTAILAALAIQDELPFEITYNNSFTVEMVLMGLIAVAWDCRTRGGMGIRFKDGNSQWRPLVFNAIINIRAAYEADVNDMSGRVETRDMRDTIAICIISVLCDIPMLNVVAGRTTFCGAPIGPKQYSDAKRRLKIWASTEDAWTCVWQSSRYLRQALYTEWGIYSSWAIYLSTLVIWGYYWCNQNQKHPQSLPLPPLTSLSEPSDVRRRISDFLDKILSARGKSPNNCEQLELEPRELLLCVSEKLQAGGESIPRDNGILLRRLVSVGSGRR